MKGLPSVGSGLIYAGYKSSMEISVSPFKIPDTWEIGYGLDFGVNCTAAVFIARDPNTDKYYIYSEYYGKGLDITQNARNLRAIGAHLLLGICDPSGRGRTLSDAKKVIDLYHAEGIDLCPGNNAQQAGINAVLSAILDSRLFVFSTCTNFLNEYCYYQYDPNKPNVPKDKQRDHALDALRYFWLSGRERMVPISEVKQGWDKDDEYDDEYNPFEDYRW